MKDVIKEKYEQPPVWGSRLQVSHLEFYQVFETSVIVLLNKTNDQPNSSGYAYSSQG